jgi:hypothetical protein
MRLSENQVLNFRARRGHLSGAGAASPAAAARAVVGIQAQVESAGFWSVAMRTEGRPSAEQVGHEVLVARRLFRTWAQRDTLHLYAVEDWPLITAADPLWPMSGRRGAVPPEHTLEETRKRLDGKVLTRADVMDLPTEEMLGDMAARVGEEQAARYAAGRFFWRLAHQGELCLAGSVGQENGYALRKDWLPSLEFPIHDPIEAACELTRRYLAVNGPATAQDVGHYFGANVTKTKEWLAKLKPELVEVECNGRRGLLALAEDAAELEQDDNPPPPRLLAAFDTLLMSHADKTWTVPDPAENKAIWRASAIVAAIVLAGGRAAAVWTQKKSKKALQITIEPLAGWKKEYLPQLEDDGQALARHLGLPKAEMTVA